MRLSIAQLRFEILFVALLASVLLTGCAADAQVDTGTILGTVKDQSGAVVPNANVTLINRGTGFSLRTTTAAGGTYTFGLVRIGTYAVTAALQGFQTVTHDDIRVDVQQQVVVNFILVPGRITQTVQVTGAPPLLQTQDASVGQVVSSTSVNDLPLNGRNYTFLAQLAAGVTRVGPTGLGLEATGTFVANGLPASFNDYLLDGIDNNNDQVSFLSAGAYAILPPPDAIQEFKVQTSNFSAEFGRAGGAVLNATIKSGTNQLHGDSWEFLRNDRLDAANFFENAANVSKGEFRQNQFGFSLGGPVVVPHVYEGKDKTFFFLDYQGTRIRQATPYVESVPTVRERASGYTDLSELIIDQTGTRTDLLGRTFPLGTIFNPATTRSVTAGIVDPVTGLVATADGFVRDPFPGNILPAGRLDPNMGKLLNVYPEPNGLGMFNNYTSDPAIRNNTDQFDTRIDHNFSGKDQLFGSISYANNTDDVPNPLPGIAAGGVCCSTGDYRNVSFRGALSETHSFSPSTINELRIGYSRLSTVQLQPFATTMGIPAQFGIQDIPQLPLNGGLPQLNISGLSQLGPTDYEPDKMTSDTSELTENLTKIFGAHMFKGGFEIQHLRFPWFAPGFPRGQFNFDGTYTEVPSTGGGSTGLAQLLLAPVPTTVPNGVANVGGADAVYASNYAGPDDVRHYYGAYAQDRWRTSRKLTLDLGLRWEFFGQVVERYGAQANFIPGVPRSGAEFVLTDQRQSSPLSPSFITTLAKDGIMLDHSGVPGLTDTPVDNFAPRFGFAYQATPKLVVRGGYGIFFGGFSNIGGAPDLGSNYPFLYSFSYYAPDPGHPILYSNGELGTLDNGLSAIPLSPVFVNAEGLALGGLQQNYRTPTTSEYNLALQYEITPNQSVQLGYVGNSSRHMQTLLFAANAPTEILPPSLNPQNYVPFPDFARDSNYSVSRMSGYYNGMQATFERRFSEGLSLLTNYTWSQCRTDRRDPLLGFAVSSYRAPYLPGFGVQGDYALCPDDRTNSFHLSGGYNLPFGNGGHFLRNARGMTNLLLGGWRTNLILTLEDGYPFGIGCPIATTADFGCDALEVPGYRIYAGPHNVNRWMNPAAFVSPPVATTVGESTFAPLGGYPSPLRGPGFHRLDFSLFKEFQTSERTRLEFRSEFFNLTNTPQFGFPSYTDFTNPSTFGRITSTIDGANDPREIQFALKFYF